MFAQMFAYEKRWIHADSAQMFNAIDEALNDHREFSWI